MGYWGWRRLLVFFLSVWVTGCTTTSDTSLNIPPTNYPPVTITVRSSHESTPTSTPDSHKAPTSVPGHTTTTYIVETGDRWETIAQRFGVDLAALRAANPAIAETPLLPGQPVVIAAPVFTQDGRPILPTATPPELTLLPPTCSAAPTGRIICYGLVENTLSGSLEQVTVRLYLFDPDGAILAQQESSLEQPQLLPGALSPYHMVFTADWDRYAGAQAVITSARLLGTNETDIIPLTIEALDMQAVNERHYRITAALVNPEMQPAYAAQVVVILYGAGRRIAGYRVVEIPGSVDARAALPVVVDVFLAAASEPVTPAAYALGRRSPPD